jgi:DNA-binding LacI/PurR family transcriptional regulator
MKKNTVKESKAKPKAPSANDVAALAGVSRTQVSYVLSGTGATHVSNEKRERILEAVRELGYRPHQSAQSLRQGFSKEFCIFFPAPYPPGIDAILGTIHEVGLARDCVVTQYSWNGYRNPSRMKETFEIMLARQPMGIFCSLLDLERSDIELARSRGIERILVLDVERHDDLVSFYQPVEEVGQLAASYLAGLGHRRIAVLKPADPVQKRPFRLRLRGMKKAIAKSAGVELSVLEWPLDSIRPTLAAARVFAGTLPRGRDGPTAIYAYGDDYALPLLRALSERGIHVPEDISVLGADDLSIAEMSTPSLSTIRFDGIDLGLRAVTMINSLITGDPLEEQFTIPPIPRVVQRESTR